jgi:dihydroneopterin aldolase/2-amino-4-hydroxy-6-hydroxymethyldihydropteridine diphosphokinase
VARAFLGVGSNIDPARNVPAAIRLLSRQVRVKRVSTLYRTAPLGNPGDPEFVNGVVEVETDRPPEDLKRNVLRAIETALGRKRTSDKNAPRTIDLDILLYDDQVFRSDDLVIPDPEIAQRPFLALPLHELDPELVLPGSGTPLRDLAARFASGAGMTAAIELTDDVRREVAHGPDEG